MDVKLEYKALSFEETEVAPGYEYAGESFPPSVVSYFSHQLGEIDLDRNGWPDLVIPLNKGYSTGVDTRTPFRVLMNDKGRLTTDPQWQAEMPSVSGARRVEHIELASDRGNAIITVQHDTGDGRGGTAVLLTQEQESGTISPDLLPPLPFSDLEGREDFVSAHAMASGDVNGDGLEDIVIGNWHWNDEANPEDLGPFVLLQTSDGTFDLDRTAVPAQYNVLLDLHLHDVDGDGYDDLVIGGMQDGANNSRILFNQEGQFSADDSLPLPESAYSRQDQLHLKTFSEDFTGNGTDELLILWSQNEPYYGGNYLQLLEQSEDGTYQDVTDKAFNDPFVAKEGEYLEWSDYVQVLDVNNDGSMDIVHSMGSLIGVDQIHLNRGHGQFETVELESGLTLSGDNIHWGDFDQDGKLNSLSMESTWNDAQGSSSTYEFNVYEAETTLPQYIRVGNVTVHDADGDGNLWNASLISPDGVTIEQSEATIFRLYLGGMARTPDEEGFRWWLDQLASGAHTLESAAAGFLNSPEFMGKADRNDDGAMSIDEFVMHMYEGVFGRAPDPTGKRWWTDALADGELTLTDGFIQMTQSDEYVKKTAAEIARAEWLHSYD